MIDADAFEGENKKYAYMSAKVDAPFIDNLSYGMGGYQGAANQAYALANYPLNSPGIIGTAGGGAAVGGGPRFGGLAVQRLYGNTARTPLGGGTTLDPRGLVPVNRVQPIAGDGLGEAQRLMENRLGTMPPSSFAGAGNAFVPVDRPATAAPIANPAVMNTDFGTTTVPVGQPQSLSAEAVRDIGLSNALNHISNPTATEAVQTALANRDVSRPTPQTSNDPTPRPLPLPASGQSAMDIIRERFAGLAARRDRTPGAARAAVLARRPEIAARVAARVGMTPQQLLDYLAQGNSLGGLLGNAG